jgi:dimethylglycine dehydrogenase
MSSSTQKPLQSHAKVVIIGGGIGGCSTLYHLTQLGWTDVVLVERDELTSGSTWHAAAQVTQFGANQTMVALKRHSIDLYRKLASDIDHPIDYHISGGMRTAYTQAQVDTYKHYIGMAKTMGVDMEFIDAAEVGKRHPLLDTSDMLGAWWDPLDGDIDPSGLTFALARKAREAGATVSRFNGVTDVTRKENGEFIVHTEKGDITCEMVVNATGYRVNEVGKMFGVEHPVTSMEHMYFVTDSIDEIRALDKRVPIIRDPRDDFYSRQEKQGLLVGVYEQGCKTFGMQGIDPNFTQALCPDDLDRCLDNMEHIFKRMPCLTKAGIHTVVNGPITYTVDGMPLIGPMPGVPNAFCCIGLRAGIGEGGGHGKVLAELMVHGESEWDAWCLDPRRFTQHANTEYTCAKTIEDYQREFHYHLPHEQRPAGRLARTTSLYAPQDQAGAVWGEVNGWERALFFKPNTDFIDQPGYRFSPTKAVVAQEVSNLQQNVGLMEVSGFSRFEISGPGSEALLNKLICGKIPSKIGRVTLCYLLNEKGHILSEATVAKLDNERYWYGAAAAAQWHDRDWLELHKPASVQVTDLSLSHTTLVVAGPKARALLQSLSERDDWSYQTMPWMSVQHKHLRHARVNAINISFSGESAYELHVANEQLYLVWKLLVEAGKAYQLGLFGQYAMESMRLEKGFRHWKADLTYEQDPISAGLMRFVDLEKADFIGKAALAARIDKPTLDTFVSLNVDCDIAAAHDGDAIYSGETLIGSVTSAGFGHRVQKNIAMGFIKRQFVEQPIQIEILGERYNATVEAEPSLYDPQYLLLRC